MKISILTPTYNRDKLLSRLYKSICGNVKHHKDVEWLIMDDGSTDNTKKTVSKWIKENKIEIKYFYQPNAGKMDALNDLIPYVTGDLVIEVDSDDYLADDCFKAIAADYPKIKKDDSIYGLLYLKKIINSNTDNKLPFEDRVITLFDLYYKYDYKTFDTFIVFKAEVRKKYKHQLEHNEKFITEARMYHKMDKEYRGLYLVNKEVINCEYYDDGYTRNILNIFKNNPYGYYEYFKELLSFDMKFVLFKKRMYMIKHYILFCSLINKGYRESIKNIKGFINKLLVALLYVPGKMMTNKKIK